MGSKHCRSDDADSEYVDSGSADDRPPKRNKKEKPVTSRARAKPKAQVGPVLIIEENPKSHIEIDRLRVSRPRDPKAKKAQSLHPNSATQLRVRAEKAEARVEQLENEAFDLHKQLEDWHERGLAGADSGKAYFQDDRKIRENVSLLFRMITDWVADSAYEAHLQKHLSSEQIEELMITIESAHPDIRCLSTAAAEKLPWCPAGCRYTAEFFLSTVIWKEILMKPFHFSEVLNHHVKKLEENMLEDSLDRRLLTSRILRPVYNSEQCAGAITARILDGNFAHERDVYYESLATYLLDPSKCFLPKVLRPCDVEGRLVRREELLEILYAAGKLSLQIWIQDSSLELVSTHFADDDLVAELRSGHCSSRTTINFTSTTKQFHNIQADWWLRIGLWLISPMFLNIDSEKWRSIKDKSVTLEQPVRDPSRSELATMEPKNETSPHDEDKQRLEPSAKSSGEQSTPCNAKDDDCEKHASEVLVGKDPEVPGNGHRKSESSRNSISFITVLRLQARHQEGTDSSEIGKGTAGLEMQRIVEVPNPREDVSIADGDAEIFAPRPQFQAPINRQEDCVGKLQAKGDRIYGEEAEEQEEGEEEEGEGEERQKGKQLQGNGEPENPIPDQAQPTSQICLRSSYRNQRISGHTADRKGHTIDLTSDDEGKKEGP